MKLAETLISENPAMQEKSPADPVPKLELPAREAHFRARCFQVANRWVNRLVNLAKAMHKGFWLGCLNADDLNTLTANRYSASKEFTSRQHLESGLSDWELPVVERYFRKGSRILVGAAGTGREVLALRKAGFKAEGFESNPTLLQVGQTFFAAMGHSNPVFFCLPDNVPPGLADYDGLIVGWGGYTHIPTRIRRVAFLQALRRRALPDAPLMLSFLTRDERSRYDRLSYRISRFIGSLFRPAQEPPEPGDDLELSDFTHRFTRTELESDLQAAGFRLLHFSEQDQLGVAVGVAE
jgi:hypothetical protein